MKIEIISCLSDNYSYLIHDEESNTVAIIDPSEFKKCDQIIKKYIGGESTGRSSGGTVNSLKFTNFCNRQLSINISFFKGHFQ